MRERLAANPLFPTLLHRAGATRALTRARAAVDRGEGDDAVFGKIVTVAERAWKVRLAAIHHHNASVALRDDVRKALFAFESSGDLFQLFNEELRVVAEMAVPGSTAALGSPHDLATVTARYEVALERLIDDAGPALARSATAISRDSSFRDAVTALNIGHAATPDVDTLGRLFRTGLARFYELQMLTKKASAEVQSLAVRVGADAENRYERTLALLLALVAATLALALVGARSIARPLSRLERRAGEISDGELGGDPLPLVGPREAAVLSQTLNDAVANLRAVEGQVRALAAGDVDAAARSRRPAASGRWSVARWTRWLARSASASSSSGASPTTRTTTR